MPTRIRLQRFGKKGKSFYHIVVADGRAPRDGRCIEKLGTYNPITDPASIELNIDRAVYWMQAGASPSETAKSLLSTKGVLYKNHLMKGLNKGALTIEQVEAKFQLWVEEKAEKINSKIKAKELEKKEGKKKMMAHEKEVNENRENEQRKALEKLAAKQKQDELSEQNASAQDATNSMEEAPVADNVEVVENQTTTPEVTDQTVENPAENSENKEAE
ncbi:MAG: 30S ribosomal protein S16 [Bacteroidales bacterium]|nr:30S ribosomal protein S16 [Bacteroidales bacterium]